MIVDGLRRGRSEVPADVHQFLPIYPVSSNRIRPLQELVQGKESYCGALLRGAAHGLAAGRLCSAAPLFRSEQRWALRHALSSGWFDKCNCDCTRPPLLARSWGGSGSRWPWRRSASPTSRSVLRPLARSRRSNICPLPSSFPLLLPSASPQVSADPHDFHPFSVSRFIHVRSQLPPPLPAPASPLAGRAACRAAGRPKTGLAPIRTGCGCGGRQRPGSEREAHASSAVTGSARPGLSRRAQPTMATVTCGRSPLCCGTRAEF